MTGKPITFQAHDLADTDRLGSVLAALLPDGTTVCLTGTLGAGKTRLVQAIATACGINPADVVSPTFVLCHHYSGTRRFNHLDAYRIRDDDEFLELGVDEMFSSDGITLVEWGERVQTCLPPDRIDIRIRVLGDTQREFQLSEVGTVDPHLLDELRRQVAS